MTKSGALPVGSRLARWWCLLAAGIVLALVVAAVIATRIGARRDEAMKKAADSAVAAMSGARAADAMTWAPDELAAAERRYREALDRHRAEEARVWPIPDADGVGGAYAEAGRAARLAMTLARERHATAVATTAELIDEATAAITASAQLASAIHLDADRRRLLSKAQLTLTEAEVYRREGDLGRATVRAREAAELAAQVRNHAAAVAARYADEQTLARWRQWKEETIQWSRREGRAAIVVAKEAHLLTLFDNGKLVKAYKVDLGFNWIADKSRANDGATPEGRYRVVSRKGSSTYYKALLLDYPNAEDRAEFNRARRTGNVPRSAGIGGLIEIHGDGGRGRDWTRGCVAVTNRDMDELFVRVSVGTPVTIVGSDDFGAMAEFATRHRTDAAGRK